jgi:F-type H+-transporting ATPase subunit gamma
MLIEPDRQRVLHELVRLYARFTFFHIAAEVIASEQGARMTAMDAATRNAKDMIDSLTLEMNRARQASITKELLEIISGAEALEG